MRAVVLDSYGDPDVLAVREVPDPVPGPEEVVVAVAATALNRADLLQRRGLYPGPPMDDEIPGMELAGRVEAVGQRATRWTPGDAVMGIVGGGAYAERIAVHERQLMAVPQAIDLVDAAAIPEVWITAWDALVLQGGLRPGHAVLVHAGASGVGTAAIQLVGAYGASAIATTSSGKVEACRTLGAALVVDYGAEDFVEAARTFTAGRGVDVVLDVVGGDYVNRNLVALAVGGRIVQVGVMGGGTAQVDVGRMLPKRATLVGTVLRPRPLEEKIALTQRFSAEVLGWFADRTVAPVIDRVFSLDAVTEAHRHMEANANIGKILLMVSGD
jgi:NADPH:quinone reductase